jgi:hypothetical protein
VPIDEGSARTIRIRRPTAMPSEGSPAPTFSVGKPLAGLRVGIRTDSAWRSWRKIASVWHERLVAGGALVSTVETHAMVGDTGAGDRKQIEELAAMVDCAIVGLGTCGSCTSFTIADSVTFEARGRPVVAVVTEEFETHGRNMATFLGHGQLKVLVLPYPLEARPDEELERIADEYFPTALTMLGISA